MKAIAAAWLVFVCSTLASDTELVAAVLVSEAGIDREPGMIAVMEVVNTRATIRGSSHADVVRRPMQFSCLNGVKESDLIAKAKLHRMWGAAMLIASSPGTTHSTRGATHYESIHFKTPKWAKGKPVVAVVGRHKFYKL